MIKRWVRALSVVSCISMSLVLVGFAHAEEFQVDSVHSSVGFAIRHLVSEVDGKFKEFDGTFSFNQANPEKSWVKAKIKTTSISTDNEKRDGHLRSPDFFDVKKYPELTFVSKEIKKTGESSYTMTGDLTMHGVTKPTTFDVKFMGLAKGPDGKMRAGFKAIGKVNRKDYGISWNKTLDAGGLMLGEDVDITIRVEAPQTKS